MLDTCLRRFKTRQTFFKFWPQRVASYSLLTKFIFSGYSTAFWWRVESSSSTDPVAFLVLNKVKIGATLAPRKGPLWPVITWSHDFSKVGVVNSFTTVRWFGTSVLRACSRYYPVFTAVQGCQAIYLAQADWGWLLFLLHLFYQPRSQVLSQVLPPSYNQDSQLCWFYHLFFFTVVSCYLVFSMHVHFIFFYSLFRINFYTEDRF